MKPVAEQMSDSPFQKGTTSIIVGWPVFTKWINGHLAGKHIQIFNIRTDLSNGVYLGLLLGYFRGKELRHLNLAPSTSEEAAKNLKYVLTEIEKEGGYFKRLANFDGIFSHDLKAILPLVAAIMSQFSGFPLPLEKPREEHDAVIARQNGIPLECLEKPPVIIPQERLKATIQTSSTPILPKVKETKVLMYTSYAPGSLVAETNIRRMKFLLEAKRVEFELIDLMENPKKKKEMMATCNTIAVPQLVVDDKHVGDYDYVQILEDAGELDDILFPLYFPEEPAPALLREETPLEMEGKTTEGSYLTIKGDGGAGSLRIEWIRQSQDGTQKVTVANSQERSYRIKSEDVGFLLVAQCWGGIRLLGTFATSEVITTGPPRISDLFFKAGPYYTDGITVHAEYSGGSFGYFIYQWYRRTGSGVITPIMGANTETYYPHIDDILHKIELCVDVAPVRTDGIMGVCCRMSIPTAPLKIDPKMTKQINETIEKGEVVYQVTLDEHKDPNNWKLMANIKKLKIRHKDKTASKLKWFSPQLWYDTLDQMDNRRLYIKFEGHEYRVAFQTGMERDTCVQIFRGLAEKAPGRSRRGTFA